MFIIHEIANVFKRLKVFMYANVSEAISLCYRLNVNKNSDAACTSFEKKNKNEKIYKNERRQFTRTWYKGTSECR